MDEQRDPAGVPDPMSQILAQLTQINNVLLRQQQRLDNLEQVRTETQDTNSQSAPLDRVGHQAQDGGESSDGGNPAGALGQLPPVQQ